MKTLQINNKTIHILQEIGKGSFGIVYKCQIDNEFYAIKKVRKQYSSSNSNLNSILNSKEK